MSNNKTKGNKMLTFHNNPEIKAKYLARVQAHYEADEIIKGIYWQNGKGCAVGCTVHSNQHQAYEEELGIPRIIARLEDDIFEGLSNVEAKEFPLHFLNAVPIGADLSGVFDKFMHWLLVDKEHGIIKFSKRSEHRAAIQGVADLFARKIAGENVELRDWEVARAAAYAADADADAYAAYAYAADAYARQNARLVQANKLIELIKAAPVPALEAQAAIVASDAKLIKGLVEHLSEITMRVGQLASGDYKACGYLTEEIGVEILHLVNSAIASLPEEYRKGIK